MNINKKTYESIVLIKKNIEKDVGVKHLNFSQVITFLIESYRKGEL